MRRFRPRPDHPEHVNLVEELCNICLFYAVDVIDVPTYDLLARKDRELYKKNFSDEALYIRSRLDKLVLTNPPFLVDAKTCVRKDTGNYSIELSSFYFNLQLCKLGVHAFYLYWDIDKEPRIFSPLSAPPSTIWIQEDRWVGADRQRFERYASTIKQHFEIGWLGRDRIEDRKEPTGGSEDPFLLIPIPTLKQCSMNLSNFLESQRSRKVLNFV